MLGGSSVSVVCVIFKLPHDAVDWLSMKCRRRPHRRSGLATLPSVGAIPYSPHISVD